MAVVVVTDSSSRLQPEDLRRCGIRQVPLHVLLDGRDFRDCVEEVPPDAHQRHATTAGATPAELAEAYREALKQSGGDGVVAADLTMAAFPAAPHCLEFKVIGTAVRARGTVRPARPFTTHLDGQGFAKLLAAGWRPMTDTQAGLTALMPPSRPDERTRRN